MTARAFVALGADEGDPVATLAAALATLDALPGTRLAAASRPRWTPWQGPPDRPGVRVLNAVVELATSLTPEDLLAHLQRLERTAGRTRDGRAARALDLDLLAVDGEVRTGSGLTLPHPRALGRAFVLAPWAEIAPLQGVTAPGAGEVPVVAALAQLRRREAAALKDHEVLEPLPFPRRTAHLEVLRDAASLRAWRAAAAGRVAMVPTMGALHAGHATLVQRAAAEADQVVATLFVNPLQFGAGEDLARYPRTWAADCDLLAAHGAHAVYAPSADDLYPQDFSTYVVPLGMAETHEGALRPGHFRGVLTVVLKLWQRCRPDRAYFAWKDAQQLALIRRMARDLDLPGVVVPCATRHAADGLALSSRNRYLDAGARARAARFPAVLEDLVAEAAGGAGRASLLAHARARLEAADLDPDYVDLVDPLRFTPAEPGAAPCLAVAAVRLGGTRLLDNRFVVDGGAADG